MGERIRGLYYPDGSFKNKQEIVDDLSRGDEQVIFTTPISPRQGFRFWHSELTRRQEAREKAFKMENHVQIEIPTSKPIRLCFIGDVHAGGGRVDYDRFAKDIAYIRDRPNTYLVTLGDLTDSFFFNPAQDEHLASRMEQYEYMRSAMDEVKGKLLVGFAGNHERWKKKVSSSQYRDFEERYNAHYLEGVGWIELKVGKTIYQITAAHKHQGYSMWNASHQSRRLAFEEGGGDINVTAHRHKKQINQRTYKEFGGEARMVYDICLGTYKADDEYARNLGHARKSKIEMGGVSIDLHPNKMKFTPHWNLTDGQS